jgi:hypothetical protein
LERLLETLSARFCAAAAFFARLPAHSEHVWWREKKDAAAMHDAATRPAMRAFLREISLTLQTACGIAKAADSLAQGGDFGKEQR